MILNKRPAILASLSAGLLMSVTACASGSFSQGIEQSLAPDPQLKDNAIALGQPAQTRVVEQPPAEIPVAPQEVTATPTTDDPNFIGPVQPSDLAAQPQATQSPVTSTTPSTFNDLDRAPSQLQPYLQDLAALGVLSGDSTSFQPNRTVNRREFARWLVAANNRIHTTTPGKQIRLASTDVQPAFQDVSRTDPDFPAIQGLAEAGLIPSPLSGDTTAVLFRPDAPLTRENLILWKVPLDTRQALPTASVEATQQTWGFEDATRIEPRALRAVLADFQNGEQANIRRVFGYTTLFQPKKPVTRAEAAAALWYFGAQGDGLSAKEMLEVTEPAS